MSEIFQIEVVYALPHAQTLKKVDMVPGCTVEQAIIRSEILHQHPEIDLTRNKLGIFGKFVRLDTLLQPLDRVEIYRPIVIDPKEARRMRAKRPAHP